MKKIKVSLTGVGGYGRVHYNLIRDLVKEDLLELSGVVIRRSSLEKYAENVRELKEMNVPVFHSDEELLNGIHPDLAVLPVGISSHRSLSELYLNAGVNVLLEKPAAGSIADVDEMIACEKRSKAFLAVAFQDMYSPEIRSIKQRILNGDFGPLKSITMEGIWLRNDTYYNRNAWAGKLRDAKGFPVLDSPINNAFAHFLNIALFCAGKSFGETAHPETMQAELVRVRPEIETFDVCALRIRANGIPIVTLMSHAGSEMRNPTIRFDFEKGKLFWSQTSGKQWSFVLPDGTVAETHTDDLAQRDMYRIMSEKINGKNEFIYTLENAREHTFAIEKLHELFSVKTVQGVLNGTQYDLPGITAVFDECFEKSLLPGEIGASWGTAVPEKKL